ncbi:hypothetical protein J132_11344 [Termitomyces sp. J132]|nr:hypothetical protein J132_11344 [Termitomyces sp. J132]
MPPHHICQLYNTVAVPTFTYAVDVCYMGVSDPIRGGRKTGAVTITRKLSSAQHRAARIVTNFFSTTAGNMLDIHANLLPIDLLFQKVLVRAAVYFFLLLPSHSMHSTVHSTTKHQVQ